MSPKITEFLNNISRIGRLFTEVFVKERRRRARIKLNRLKDQLRKLENLPPTPSRARKYNKLDKKVRDIEDYLIEDK